jgi:hypothetical protein
MRPIACAAVRTASCSMFNILLDHAIRPPAASRRTAG